MDTDVLYFAAQIALLLARGRHVFEFAVVIASVFESSRRRHQMQLLLLLLLLHHLSRTHHCCLIRFALQTTVSLFTVLRTIARHQ